MHTLETLTRLAGNTLRPAQWTGPVTCTAPPLGKGIFAREVCGGAVGADWKCQRCGQNAEMGTHRGQCDDCGQWTTIIRARDKALSTCHCIIPADRQAKLEADERARQEKAERDRLFETARRRQEAEMAQEKADASRCLADPEFMARKGEQGVCREKRPPHHPFPMCHACRVNVEAMR